MPKADFNYAHRLRVRWSEADPQGVVFHGHYLNFFDTAMTEYMRDLGYAYPGGLKESGTDLFVVKAAVELHDEVRFDDVIDIHARVARIGRSSLTFRYEVHREPEDRALASGESVYVNVDVKTRKSAELPGELTDKVKAREPAL